MDVIDPSIQVPRDLDEEKTARRKGMVRAIIINHLDEEYHKRILHMKDPRDIISKLKEFKRNETNVTHSSVRTRLYQLKMKSNEKVFDFCERFDTIVREYENCGGAVPLTDQEKRSAFYQAVSGQVPELRSADLIRKQTESREMNLEEIKSFISQLEAERHADDGTKEEVKANLESIKDLNCNMVPKVGAFGAIRQGIEAPHVLSKSLTCGFATTVKR